MIEIEGFWWFVGALLVCGAHLLYLRSWRRERRAHLAWWTSYDARSQQQHEEFMSAVACERLGWNLSRDERGQA